MEHGNRGLGNYSSRARQEYALSTRWEALGQANSARSMLLLLTLAAAALRLGGAGSHDLWIDEAFSLWMAQQPLPDLWSIAASLDHHPPLYYSLLRGWIALVGESEYALRSLSAWCSVATVPLFYQLARKLLWSDKLTRWAVPVATLLLICAPFHVSYAQEARMYALLALAAVGAIVLAVNFLGQIGSGKLVRSAAALGVVQAVVMWSHNTAALHFPVALNLAFLSALLVERRQATAQYPHRAPRAYALRIWFLGQALAFLFWLPWLPSLLVQARDVAQRFWVQPPTVDAVWLAFQAFSFGHPPPGWLWGEVIVALFVIVALMGVYGLRRYPMQLVFLLAMWLTGPALSLILSVLFRPIFLESTLIWTTFAYYIILAVGVIEAARLVHRFLVARGRTAAQPGGAVALVIMLLAGALLAGMGGGLMGHFTGKPQEAWRAAAMYVLQQAEPGDLVLFHASWTQLPFMYYATRHGADFLEPRGASGYENNRRNVDTLAIGEYDRQQALPDAFAVDARSYRAEATPFPWDVGGVPVDLFARGELEPAMLPEDVAVLQERIEARARVWLIYAHAWYTDPRGLVLETLMNELEARDHAPLSGVDVYLFVRRAD